MALPDLSRLPALGTPPLTTDTIAGVVASSQQNARWTLSQIGSVTSGSFTVINVKNYGAVGNGSADDTTAIQNALNAAFSNGSNSIANIPVYFPAGNYKITHPLYILNTAGAYVFGAGMLSTQITNTGSTNASFTASIAAALPDFNYSSVMTVTAISAGTIYRGTLVSGGTAANPTIVADQLTGTPGGTGTYIVTPQGSAVGSASMTGVNTTALLLDGVAYSTFEEFFIAAGTGGVAVEWSWSRTTTSPWAAQIMLFKHVFFQGGDYGCRVGVGQQCDTSTWIDCFFGGAAVAGLQACNLNSIGHTVLGGNFASNAIGIRVLGGSFMNISGVNFEVQTGYDISIEGGAIDTYSIRGCSSESTNFLQLASAAAGAVVTGCAQRSLGDGQFANYSAPLTIDGCRSTQGRVTNANPKGSPLRITNSIFYRTDALNYSVAGIAEAEIVQTDFGDPINSVADRWRRKKLTIWGTRTYDVEAQALTDTTALYASANINTNADNVNFTVNISTPAKATFTLAAHSFRAGLAVAFKTSGALPTGLSVDTTYYVVANQSISSVVNTANNGSGLIRVQVAATASWTFSPSIVIAGSVGQNINGSYGFTIIDSTHVDLVGSVFVGATTGGSITPTGTNNFQVSTTVGGAAIVTSGSQSGTHTIRIVRVYAIGDQILKNNVASGGSPGWICTTAGPALTDGTTVAVLKPFTATVT